MEQAEMSMFLETPGGYYAIAYGLSLFVQILLQPQRRKLTVVLPVCAAGIAALFWFMQHTGHLPIGFFVPLMLIDVGLLYLMHRLCVNTDRKSALYGILRAFMMGELNASLEWLLLSYSVTYGGARMTPLLVGVVCGLTTAGLLVPSAFFEHYLAVKKPDMIYSRTELLGEVLIVLVMYTISNISFITQSSPFTARFTKEILLLRMYIDAAGVIILCFYTIVLYQSEAQTEVRTLRTMLDLQYQNYKTSRDSVDLINRKYHDMKNQIAVLRSLSDSQKTDESLDRLESEIRQYEANNRTGNQALDIILTSKSLVCQNHHITLTVVADGAAIDFMDIMDISSLFGNALDNAIEAVRQISDYSERLIHLTLVRQKNFIHIRCDNRYTGKITFRNHMPVSTKGDDRFHGFGVKSIAAVATKYGGTASTRAEDGYFYLDVLLPVPKEQQGKN